ncbi:MAG: DUF559 domain-containing protein [Acidobacteriota bacterium]
MRKRRHYRGGFQFSVQKALARECRKTQTTAEDLLWQLLRNRQVLGFKFRRQHDQERDAYMISQGIKMLRFSNDRVFNDMANVMEEICKALMQTGEGERQLDVTTP